MSKRRRHRPLYPVLAAAAALSLGALSCGRGGDETAAQNDALVQQQQQQPADAGQFSGGGAPMPEYLDGGTK